MLNRVILIGRLTKDPELRYTPNGIAVTNFTLAVDATSKTLKEKRKQTSEQLAELCANYLAKGKIASIDGDHLRKWVKCTTNAFNIDIVSAAESPVYVCAKCLKASPSASIQRIEHF